jgi:hypothetical protein
MPAGARRIRPVLRGIELILVLETSTGAVGIDHERRDQEAILGDALRPEDYPEVCPSCGGADGGPCTLEERLIGRRHAPLRRSIPGYEALGKTNEIDAVTRRAPDRLFGQRDRFLGRFWGLNVGKRDTEHRHFPTSV